MLTVSLIPKKLARFVSTTSSCQTFLKTNAIAGRPNQELNACSIRMSIKGVTAERSFAWIDSFALYQFVMSAATFTSCPDTTSLLR